MGISNKVAYFIRDAHLNISNVVIRISPTDFYNRIKMKLINIRVISKCLNENDIREREHKKSQPVRYHEFGLLAREFLALPHI